MPIIHHFDQNESHSRPTLAPEVALLASRLRLKQNLSTNGPGKTTLYPILSKSYTASRPRKAEVLSVFILVPTYISEYEGVRLSWDYPYLKKKQDPCREIQVVLDCKNILTASNERKKDNNKKKNTHCSQDVERTIA